MRLRDTYLFSAQGNGKLTVTIGGQPAFEAAGDDLSKKEGEPVKLNKGKNPIVVRYEGPATATPASAYVAAEGRVDARAAGAAGVDAQRRDQGGGEGRRVREGRFLLAQLRCVGATQRPRPSRRPASPPRTGPSRRPWRPPGRMPELAMDAPNLSDAGPRLNREWVAAWVNNPRALHPDAHMPRVFHDDKPAEPSDKITVDPRAADVAAYLATLGGKGDKRPPPRLPPTRRCRPAACCTPR